MIRRLIERVVAWWSGGDCGTLIVTMPKVEPRMQTLNTAADLKREPIGGIYLEDSDGRSFRAAFLAPTRPTVTRSELDALMEGDDS